MAEHSTHGGKVSQIDKVFGRLYTRSYACIVRTQQNAAHIERHIYISVLANIGCNMILMPHCQHVMERMFNIPRIYQAELNL